MLQLHWSLLHLCLNFFQLCFACFSLLVSQLLQTLCRGFGIDGCSMLIDRVGAKARHPCVPHIPTLLLLAHSARRCVLHLHQVDP